MKNTQLRTGNLVFHDGLIKTVDAISRGHICFTEDIPSPDKYGEWKDLDEVEFIPVTAERLTMLGLVSDGILFDLPEWIKEKCQPDNGFKRSAFFFNNREDLKKWMDCQTRVCVDNIHQVQNLVFALTGEELCVIQP